MFDIMTIFYNIVALFILAVVVTICVWKWKAILYFLTGDDKVHWSVNDSIFCCFFNCCGLHHFDWTRRLSMCCCKCDWGPFSTKYAGRNLVRILGEWLGLVAVQVCIENVVVGDLPTFWTRGRNYLKVDAGDNPSQVSEVVDEGNPKCIRFNTKFQIALLRHNPRRKVRLVVCDMHMFGHTDICECYVSESDIVDWSGAGWYNPRGPIRLEMTACRKESSPGALEMPSWIFLEFTLPGYVPPKGRLMGGFSIHLERSRLKGASSLGTDTIDYESATDFKREYQLLSAHGGAPGPEHEPNEEVYDRLQALERQHLSILGFIASLVILIWTVFFVWNTYVGACYVEFKRVEVLRLHGHEFPVAEVVAKRTFAQCGLSDRTLSIVAKMYYKLAAGYLAYAVQGVESAEKSARRLSGGKAVSSNHTSSDHTKSTDTVGLAQIPDAEEACHPPFSMVRETCHDLPRGQGTVMFPAPYIGDYLHCDPNLSCQAGLLKFAKELFLAGVAVLALLPCLWCFLRAQFRFEQKKLFRTLGEQDGAPPGCFSCCMPGSASKSNFGAGHEAADSGGKAWTPSQQTSKRAGSLFSKGSATASPGGGRKVASS